MISAPTPESCSRTKASSMPRLPPGWATISPHQRVASIHSCSLSPAWPNGASRLWGSPVPKPSSEMENCWTRASDIGWLLRQIWGWATHTNRPDDAGEIIGRRTDWAADPGAAEAVDQLLPRPEDEHDAVRLEEGGLLDLEHRLPSERRVERVRLLVVAHPECDQGHALLHSASSLRSDGGALGSELDAVMQVADTILAL